MDLSARAGIGPSKVIGKRHGESIRSSVLLKKITFKHADGTKLVEADPSVGQALNT